ncbi:MAG: excisionase family DNA-binding protein [Spirochaetota bacterium]
MLRVVEQRKGRKPLRSYLELAEVLNVNRVTLRCYVSERRIPFIRIGRAVRFELEADLGSLRERA